MKSVEQSVRIGTVARNARLGRGSPAVTPSDPFGLWMLNAIPEMHGAKAGGLRAE